MNRESMAKVKLLLGGEAFVSMSSEEIEATNFLAQDEDGAWFLYDTIPVYDKYATAWLNPGGWHKCVCGETKLLGKPEESLMELP